MKKTIITMLVLAGAAMADTLDLTWVGPDNGKWNVANNWVITGTENHPDSVPAYTNTTDSVYRLNDGAKVSAEGVSIGNLNGKLIAGDNVSFGGNWAVIFKDVEIGKNFTWTSTSGDQFKFILGTGYTIEQESTANTVKIDSVYEGNYIITTLGKGSSIDFCTEGKIVCTANSYSETCLGQYSAGNPRALTLSAQIVSTIAADEEETGIQNRVLIEAPGIWYRDKNGVYRDDIFGLTLTSLDGTELVKYDSVMDPNAAWTFNGEVVATEDLQAGAYRSYATTQGIGVQYNIVPEPATATLSLLALAGLAARRRRH